MIYLFSIYLIFTKKKSYIKVFLISLVVLSCLLGYFVARKPLINNELDVFNVFFTVTIIVFLIEGYKKYNNLKCINYQHTYRFSKINKILLILGLIALLINIVIVIKAFGALIAEDIVVNKYKNEGEASEYLSRWVSPFLLTLSRFLSPLGYIGLGLHFYFLIKRMKFQSILFFIISLNIPLLGFHGLSRSAALQFILTYLSYFLYSYPALEKTIKKKFVSLGIVFLVAIIFFLGIITVSRFSNYSNIPRESHIQDPILYSLFDYGSQWNENGIALMSEYSSEKLLYGQSTVPIAVFIYNRLGFEMDNLSDMRKKKLGEKFDGTFNGVVATLLFDFGYFFTFFFVLIYYQIVRKNSPINGHTTLINFLNYGVLIPLPLLFFSNNVYSNLTFNIGIIYLLVYNKIIKQ